MGGDTCSIITQFSNPPASFNAPTAGNWFRVEVDDLITWDKHHIEILPPEAKEDSDHKQMFRIGVNNSRMSNVDFTDLLHWGYRAEKEGTAVSFTFCATILLAFDY